MRWKISRGFNGSNGLKRKSTSGNSMQISDASRLNASAERYKQRVGRAQPAASRSARTTYLSRNLAGTKAKMFASAAVVAGAPPTPGESLAQISQERIIGSS